MLPGNQANVEYFFRLLYDLLVGLAGAASLAAIGSFFAHLWAWVVGIGYSLSVLALAFIIYFLVRIFELREREAKFFGTLILAPESAVANHRWEHVQSLMDGASPSEWREAITEADIMLDDLLNAQGYTGEGVGEKLRQADPEDFHSLSDAWEAHKVRNQIAHQGSAFELSDTLAHRTIQRYERVFREFGFI